MTLRVDTTQVPYAALAQRLTLFMRIVDVDAAGRAETVGNLVAPARVADPTRPFTVTMPAFVHRFKAGHTLRLVISGGSTNYRGGMVPLPVTIPAGVGQEVTLPVI